MKRLSICSALLLVCAGLGAQTGVIDIHPASNPDGKYLDQAGANISRDTRPMVYYAHWIDGGSFVTAKPDRSRVVVDAATGEERPYNPEANPIKAPKPAPKGATGTTVVGEHLVYAKGSSLYMRDDCEKVHTIAESPEPGIVFGQSVSRNEFGINGGIFPSPKGNKVAFYRKDERAVSRFPLLDITTRTGSLQMIRYPMNGMTSEKVSVGVYDFHGGNVVWLACNDFAEDKYMTNVSWSADGQGIYVQVVDREQHHMRLNKYSAVDGSFIKTILTEENDAWIEPLDPVAPFGESGQFIYRTDNRDGYRNLYLCDDSGAIRRITSVDADVEYLANDGKYVYYTSAEVSPVENHLFRMQITNKKGNDIAKAKFGKPERLTSERGWHNISLSPDCSWFIDAWSSFNVPGRTDVASTDGKVRRELLTSPDPLADYVQCEVDFGTVKSADGLYDNHYRLFKPKDFDPSKKYPLIVYVYGGPHSQMVRDNWLGNVRLWEMYMAQRGYVVYVQDNRGTPNRGAAYEKAINRQCGQVEMQDQMEGVKMLLKEPWVDASRVGVHGWSYGGFMTISLLTNYPDVFKVGVAGGPVIDWKWYEIMYGERYMDTEATNPEGFAKTSLINKAADLKGKLLICQGAIDNTVVWEHSLSFVQKCIEQNVQLDYFPYPCSEHNVFGQWRVHLMDKVTEYFNNNL